jgi:hypothetical protein
MRSIFTLSLVFLLLACSNKETSDQSDNSTSTAKIDFVAPPSLDTALFIAEATYSPATMEFYTTIHLQTGKEPAEPYEKLDSTTTQKNGDVTRKELPIAEANKYFYLKGLDTLSFYNKDHKLIANVPLTGVSYMEDGVSEDFVAVYKVQNPVTVTDNFVYCVSNQYPVKTVSDFSSAEVTDEALNKKIAKELKVKSADGWVMHHIKTMPSGNIYSIVTKETRSLIVETTPAGMSILKEVNNDYHFGNMFPLPMTVNNKPLLLISYYVPETDLSGNFTASFNGTGYHEVHYNRVPLNQLANN